jgi:sulfatase modifying factor 1
MRLLHCLLAFALMVATSLGGPRALAQNHAPQTEPFRDCSECPVMVPIPPGSFVMGVASDEEERENVLPQFRGWSAPQHLVTFRESFAIGKYDITRNEFADFVRESSYRTGDTCWNTVDNAQLRRNEMREVAQQNWAKPGFPQTGKDPVVCVSWNDAKAYVDWLSSKTHRKYRLPTEAEWEYAARAGTEGARYWGDSQDNACAYANVSGLSRLGTTKYPISKDRFFACWDSYRFTSPVDAFPPNPFGIHDVLGNVAQWVEDCWNQGYVGAPTDGSAWLSGECRGRPIRGATWNNPPNVVHVGNRAWLGVGMRMGTIGFRVAGPVDNLISVAPRDSARHSVAQN